MAQEAPKTVAPIVEVSSEPEAETIAAVADIAPAVVDIPDVVAEVSAVEEVSKASVPQTIEEGIVFSIEAPNAQCVQLAGDFNGWTAEGNEMELNAGIWRKVVPLPPGLYLYRFVVDGVWMTDPLNVNVQLTPWGAQNSVFRFEKTSDSQPLQE
jgi:1,4-alpha-glucan branching enzyme